MAPPDPASHRAAAREARFAAHAPYSRFHVGAAILMESGRVITGCNVENASYGLTICAERTAMVRAVAEGAGKPVAIAIASDSPVPTPPCGACRQFLAEFNPTMRVIYGGAQGEAVETTLDVLLPGLFDASQLPSD
jgi:cytidine deaminase